MIALNGLIQPPFIQQNTAEIVAGGRIIRHKLQRPAEALYGFAVQAKMKPRCPHIVQNRRLARVNFKRFPVA